MRLTMSKHGWVVIVAIFALFDPCLLAQTASTGAISGVITDSTGAVVPNATITATSDTGQVRTATSGGDGSYNIQLLPPGKYRVKFDAGGFQSVENPSVTVTVTETGTLNESLAISSQNQEVTVQADVEAVQTTNSTVGTVITQVTELPLANRNYTVLIGLSAGANAGVVNAAAGLGNGTQVFAVNGASTSDNNYQMDGVTINTATSSSIQEGKEFGVIGIPNPDAIEEFKIQTSTYDAGYGRNSGGNVNVVTKSGTNAFHGTAWEYFRNTSLNANDFFNKLNEITSGKPNARQVLNQNQYGGVVGGPIKKDKLFFFASYQETKQKNGITNQGAAAFNLPYITPPSVTSDRTSAAFLNDMLAHYCGAAGSLGGIQIKAPAGGCTKTSPFFSQYNAALATANINPIALNIVQTKLPNGNYYLPSPLVGNAQVNCNPTPSSIALTDGAVYGCTSSIPATYAEYQGLGNLDYVINSKNTISGRYFATNTPIYAPFFGGTGFLPGIALPGEPITDQYMNDEAVLKLTTLVTSNLVNEARLSYQFNYASQLPQGTLTSSQLGIAPMQPNYDNFPTITTDTFTIGQSQNIGAVDKDNQFEVADQISWTHGKHTLRFGGEYEHDYRKWNFPGLALGSLGYSTFPDLLISLPGCTNTDTLCGTGTGGKCPTTTVDLNANTVQNNGTANSNLSLNASGSAVRYPTNPLTTGAIEYNPIVAFNAFVQDDLKINSRLTLNLGLRWEYDGQPSEIRGKFTDVWTSRVLAGPYPLVTTPCTGNLYQTTGCPGSTFAGYVIPANYSSLLPTPPAGVFQSSHDSPVANPAPKDNFAPRLGLAWQPLAGNAKWVLRAGAGYFYSRVQEDSTYSNVELEQIPMAYQPTTQFNADLANPYGNVQPGWQPRWVAANGASSNIRVQTMAEQYPTPLVYQWNLNTQYEFLPTWVVEVGYVGSRGIHEPLGFKPNGAVLVGPTQPSPTNSATTTNTTTNTAFRSPYAGFANNWQVDGEPQDFKFNSAQVTVRKQLSHGFQFQSAYTWSRAFVTSQVGNPNASLTDDLPTIFEYGLNSMYAPQRLALSYHWDLPFGHPDGLAGKAVTGWAVSGVTIIQDGTPLTITDTRGGTIFGSPVTSNAQFAAGMTNANVASSGSLYQRVIAGNFFNPAAFVKPVTGGPAGNYGNGTGYGNAGLGIILGPPQKNFDITVEKVTKVGGIREGAALVFRADFINAFNHTQFSNPTSTSVSAGTFGKIQSTSVNPRLIQLALKYQF